MALPESNLVLVRSISVIMFVILEKIKVSGRIVSELMEETLSAGNHTIEWNGCFKNGELVSGGLYFCRIEHSGVVETPGLCVLK